MERKIGDIFEYDNKKIKVVKCYCDRCLNCAFAKDCAEFQEPSNVLGECASMFRSDDNDVYFKDITMKNKEKRKVELTLKKAKEWYKKGGELKEVALQAFNESELKDNRSHSLEEFFRINDNLTSDEYWGIKLINCKPAEAVLNSLYPTVEYATAARALAKLLLIRQEWIGDWEPKWEAHTIKYCIVMKESKLTIEYDFFQRVMSFPTEEMAKEFLNDFNDLLWEAKLLL